jgi:hypothetical protein
MGTKCRKYTRRVFTSGEKKEKKKKKEKKEEEEEKKRCRKMYYRVEAH